MVHVLASSFLTVKQVPLTVQERLSRNPPHYIIFEVPVLKTFRSFAIYLPVSNICGKLVPLALRIISNDNVKFTPVAFSVAYFKLSSSESDNLKFTLLYCVILS